MGIEKQAFISKFTKVFKDNGFGNMISLDIAEVFLKLTERMLEENEKYNLTAITDVDKIILSHYADCAALAKRLPQNAKIADIGCGAGFPTLPIAILRPDVTILAVDSTAKRIGYVNETAALLGLTNVTAVAMRAEDGGKNPEYRERFDVVTARAVAEMRVLSELCLPLVKVGGEMIAMKGKNAEFELTGAKRAIATLGGRDASGDMITLTDGGEETLTHPVIVIKKKEHTPSGYPRAFAQISKKPL
jgi:16S rRNA (guanine527-N7)-methyltransferase